jgi:hypothetical protein
MPFDAARDEIEADFAILEAIGRLYEDLSGRAMGSGASLKTLRRWLVGHRDMPQDPDEQIVLMSMALDLDNFTPSPSGKTPVDRYLDSHRPQSEEDRRAWAALRAAQFRLVRIVGRESPDLVRLKDLATGESLLLLQSTISPAAAGGATAMRLCPLASGRHVLISPLFLIDETMLADAMGFVRPGRGLGNGYRCAANLYRDAARRGFLPMPKLADLFGARILDDLSEVQQLALSWLDVHDAEDEAELIAAIRRAASLDLLVDACGWFANACRDGQDRLEQAYFRIADIVMETLCQRARAGVAGSSDLLNRAITQIVSHIAAGRMGSQARDLFVRLQTRWSLGGGGAKAGEGADPAELDRVIQRILALRAKTVDRGCTEQEAMAAAAKVAELLARHDLSLDEVAVRKSDCAGAAVETRRRRSAPVDACVQPVAAFCDCKAWREQTDSGVLRYIFFGLRADVEAARFLHDLIEDTFDTESAIFRGGSIYLALEGGERRTALNSFQIGLANGINNKLDVLKRARTATAAKTTGFDLVGVKQSVVDEELEKLGLHFTRKASSSRRRVFKDAYEAGKAAGAQFEPHRSVGA